MWCVTLSTFPALQYHAIGFDYLHEPNKKIEQRERGAKSLIADKNVVIIKFDFY
jgi:hypothetical protein